jgi:protein-tyrosine phosphatase
MDWIADNYGSKRGMVRHFYYRVGWRLHPATRSQVELAKARRLVFVCKGNICRSALGQAVAESVGFPACSFGVRTVSGKLADPGMLAAAAALGYDLSGHRTTQVSEYSAAAGDLVLFFENDHFRQFKDGSNLVAGMAFLGMWARPPQPYIHDPFGGTHSYYGKTAGVIHQAVLALIMDIRARHGH